MATPVDRDRPPQTATICTQVQTTKSTNRGGRAHDRCYNSLSFSTHQVPRGLQNIASLGAARQLETVAGRSANGFLKRVKGGSRGWVLVRNGFSVMFARALITVLVVKLWVGDQSRPRPLPLTHLDQALAEKHLSLPPTIVLAQNEPTLVAEQRQPPPPTEVPQASPALPEDVLNGLDPDERNNIRVYGGGQPKRREHHDRIGSRRVLW